LIFVAVYGSVVVDGQGRVSLSYEEIKTLHNSFQKSFMNVLIKIIRQG